MTIHVTLFSDEWYHGIINQNLDYAATDNVSDDALAVSRGIMVAGCCIAQAIDNAFGEIKGEATTRAAIESIASSLERIAEHLENSK